MSSDVLKDSLAECGLPSALAVMGDRWSFMILHAAFNGVCHFEDFLEALGIARNVLASRLSGLVAEGIMERKVCEHDRRKAEYRLTEKGIDLLPSLLALRQWGEKYGLRVASNPVLADQRDGRPIAPMTIHAHDGRSLAWHDLKWLDRSQVGQSGECCD
ncbi:MAG: helix-turn-helix transcriptional regulator [Alphaproteobacteria bacterium]|nr:helix-turn-helix transcriptional regulator [Alphaproteobacteria bacterium]